MAKPTKKELREHVREWQKGHIRYAQGLCTGGRKAPRPPLLAWRGLALDCSYVRQGRAICGVPSPYHAFQLWYEAWDPVTGKLVASGQGTAQLIDALFLLHARGDLRLAEQDGVPA